MKYKIGASVFVILVLIVLYVMFSGSSTSTIEGEEQSITQ